ncbi:MAG: hypothetical protein IT210_10255 [Armatimonadetes bacterium]|nr:hypothetical protein [Armatimonadota bacterium]
MTSGYWVATWILVLLFISLLLAAYFGLGLPSDTQAMAQTRSVRTGSLHTRSYFGGGPGFGK